MRLCSYDIRNLVIGAVAPIVFSSTYPFVSMEGMEMQKTVSHGISPLDSQEIVGLQSSPAAPSGARLRQRKGPFRHPAQRSGETRKEFEGR